MLSRRAFTEVEATLLQRSGRGQPLGISRASQRARIVFSWPVIAPALYLKRLLVSAVVEAGIYEINRQFPMKVFRPSTILSSHRSRRRTRRTAITTRCDVHRELVGSALAATGGLSSDASGGELDCRGLAARHGARCRFSPSAGSWSLTAGEVMRSVCQAEASRHADAPVLEAYLRRVHRLQAAKALISRHQGALTAENGPAIVSKMSTDARRVVGGAITVQPTSFPYFPKSVVSTLTRRSSDDPHSRNAGTCVVDGPLNSRHAYANPLDP
jgi:hypothetical protein